MSMMDTGKYPICSHTGMPIPMCAHCRSRFASSEVLPIGRCKPGTYGLDLPTLSPLSKSGMAARSAAQTTRDARWREPDPKKSLQYHPLHFTIPSSWRITPHETDDLRWCWSCKTITRHTKEVCRCGARWRSRSLL